MKKSYLIFLLFLGCLTLPIHANVVPPIVLSEIYFDDNDNWSIELYDFFQFGVFPIEIGYLVSSTDTAYFDSVFTINPDDTLIITNADMQSNLSLKRDSDYIKIYNDYYGSYILDIVSWGDTSSSYVNAPYSGQSLCRVDIGGVNPYLPLAKENQPSLGYNPFNVQTYGAIQGHIMDGDGNIIQGAQVDVISPMSFSLSTDDEGYFYADSLYAMNYTLSAYKQGYTSNEITVTVEPDSTTNVNFFLYPLSSGPNQQVNTFSISNHPNPFYEETQIHYSLPYNSSGTITIFNSKGQKVIEIPVSPIDNSISWSGLDEHNKKVPSGVYFYNLESENKTLDSEKMLYLR